MELLPFVDILKVFNNPINEEQAWAVCYQCAYFLFGNQNQGHCQVMFDYGIHSIWLSRHGDVLLRKGPLDPNGSGKGPPQHHHSPHGSSHTTTVSSKRKRHVIATETDAVQALGTAIFEALDFGIDPSEERQLSPGLESLIVTMTNSDSSLEYDPDATNADDEGIEKDADIDHRCTVQDVMKLCSQHLSSKQDAQHHYKAVCRALATEASELFTFLEKIATSKEKLTEVQDDDTKRLEELQRADWACLWVQVMRSLRQGVRLKKVEHVINLPPVEYELTPFEMLLEDIRSRRYTLHKIMVDGEIPSKVKNDAHAVILDFIRSRPPLKKVHERKLKPKPPPVPDPHERLLKEIRSRPKLRPVKHGRLLVATPGSRLKNEEELEPAVPVKRVIKPDLNLLLNNSFEESSEDEDHSNGSSLTSSPMSASSGSNMTPPFSSWQRTVTGDAFLQESSAYRPTRLQRRHTIMVCDSSMDGKVAAQELPPLEEEDEPSPVRESHHISSQSLSKYAQGLAALQRTSYSDNDLSVQVTLRNPQGLPRRSCLEHRRSLTSLTSGLSAIPEIEDSPSGTDQPSKPSGVQRSRSHEQAPPPNPSPPCKGRARAALGMGMTSMKPASGVYHPGSHRQHASQTCTLSSHSLSSGMASDSIHTSIPASSSQAVSKSQMHDLLTSASAPPPSSMLNSSSSTLDTAVSSQSPGYLRREKMLQSQRLQSETPTNGKIDSGRSIDRWRHPLSRKERFESRITKIEDNSLDVVNNVSEHEEDNQYKRLSLDSGVNIYIESGNMNSGLVDFDRNVKARRRLSIGSIGFLRKGKDHGAEVSHRKARSPEEEERLSRWKTLQEDELASRTRKVGQDMTNQLYPSAKGSSEHTAQPHKNRLHTNKKISQPACPNQNMDAVEQKTAHEEARFARWLHLEETGELVGHSDKGMKFSSTNKEYANDLLSGSLQPGSIPVNMATTVPISLKEIIPLPKRWQNPVECLSLTLEEVTHIRTVLTKAELESLISHPELYQQVSRGKLCFTCKTTKFSLFGEWGTKCRFCKRTVCSKCLRKMNVPTEEFKLVPVYTLSPTPPSPEVQEFIHNYIKNAPPLSVLQSPVSSMYQHSEPDYHQKQMSQLTEISVSQENEQQQHRNPKNLFINSKPLQRSQSLLVPGYRQTPGVIRTFKGPTMTICCDCKGMVMEIIRATQASLVMLSASNPLLHSLLPASMYTSCP